MYANINNAIGTIKKYQFVLQPLIEFFNGSFNTVSIFILSF